MVKTDDFSVLHYIFSEICLKPRFTEINHISCKHGCIYLFDSLQLEKNINKELIIMKKNCNYK